MNRKIIFLLMSVISLSAILLSSCKKEEASGEVKMVGFYITPRTSFVEVGETQDITVWASYTDGSKVNMTDSVQITSSDPTTVTVIKGVAKGLKDGKAILTATYKDRMDTCSFTASSIEKITLSIDGVEKNLLTFPESEFGADQITVKAFYKTGDSTTVKPDTLLSLNNNFEVVYKDGELKGLKVARVQDDFAQVFANYISANGKTYQTFLDVFVGKVDTVELSLDVTKLEYNLDTLQLGATSSIVAKGWFSWTGFKDTVTVDALPYVSDSLVSFNTAILGIEDGSVIANDTTVKGKHATFTATFFGKKYNSRPIAIVADTTYKEPTYMVDITAEYAYTGDVITYKFLEDFGNGVVVDLTNTGNKNITSTFGISGEPKSDFSVISSGLLSLTDKVTAREDSVAVCVIYDKGAEKDTTFSKEFRVYNNPTLEIKKYQSGAMSILLNGQSKHLWTDECTIVDNSGKDYTKQIHYDSSNDYVLDIKPDMWGKTYIFTYGPEKRTAVLSVPATPEK